MQLLQFIFILSILKHVEFFDGLFNHFFAFKRNKFGFDYLFVLKWFGPRVVNLLIPVVLLGIKNVIWQ